MARRVYNQFVLTMLSLVGYSFFAIQQFSFIQKSHPSYSTLLLTLLAFITIPLFFLYTDDFFDLFGKK